MPKKKTKKAAKPPPVEEAAPAAEKKPQALEEKPAVPEKKDSNSLLKILVIGAIFVLALALAYYFLVVSAHSFAPGTPVDEETFKGIFLGADKVYILMDVRSISDSRVSDNVMQCGVDFAGSSGVASKIVIPMSIGNDGCVTPDGPTPMDRCFSMLKDGITIYVRSGDGGVWYYNNGMVVTVGSQYTLGTCGIHRS